MSDDVATLTYFDGRGLGEVVRLMMAACKISWKEVHIRTREEFLQLRDVDRALEYGHLPLLEYRGQRLVQSQAILRYLGATHGLYGDTPEQRFQADAAQDTVRDLFSKLSGLAWTPPEALEEHVAKNVRPLLPKYLPYLEQRLLSREWLAGHLSFADVSLFEAFTYLNEKGLKEDLQAYPKIVDHAARFAVLVKHYLDSPLRHDWPDEKYKSEVRASLNF